MQSLNLAVVDNFPSGELITLHGLLSELNKKSNFIFVDSGDTFFKQNFPMKDEKESQVFRAKKLATALSMTSLQLKVIGDQDMAFGVNTLGEIVQGSKLRITWHQSKIKKVKFFKFKKYDFHQHKIFFMGISSSKLFTHNDPELIALDHFYSIEKQLSL